MRNVDPGDLTWKDVADFVKEAHLDRSEYFRADLPADGPLTKTSIWRQGHTPISFWLVGGNEGYYVHVGFLERKRSASPEYTDMLIGKFWSREDAVFSSNLISTLLNGIFGRPIVPQVLIYEGRARFP